MSTSAKEGQRHRGTSKSRAEDRRAIDVRSLARGGMLRPGSFGTWRWTRNGKTVASLWTRTELEHVVLMRKPCGDREVWRQECHPVRIERTSCNLGGSRAWFVCPGSGCGRRVAILYDDGRMYGCRQCCNLAYASTRENAGFRAMRQAERIRARLGWPHGILNATGEKPKWMRWTTFTRLVLRHHQLGFIAIEAIAARFGFANRFNE